MKVLRFTLKLIVILILSNSYNQKVKKRSKIIQLKDEWDIEIIRNFIVKKCPKNGHTILSPEDNEKLFKMYIEIDRILQEDQGSLTEDELKRLNILYNRLELKKCIKEFISKQKQKGKVKLGSTFTNLKIH